MCDWLWIDESDPSTGYRGGYYRSDCGYEFSSADEDYDSYKFCPMCGSELRLMSDEEVEQEREIAYADLMRDIQKEDGW